MSDELRCGTTLCCCCCCSYVQEAVHALRLPPRGPPMLRLAAPVDVPGPETMKQLYGVGGDDAAVTPTTLLPDSPARQPEGAGGWGHSHRQFGRAGAGDRQERHVGDQHLLGEERDDDQHHGRRRELHAHLGRTHDGGQHTAAESRDSAGNLTHMDTMDLLFPSHTPTSPPMEATMAGDGP